MKYFNDIDNPTANELLNYLQREFTSLWIEMSTSDHAVCPGEPNPYHTEGLVSTHTCMVLLQAENDNANKVNLISALLHDTGKPLSRIELDFKSKKPVFTESNEIRNNGMNGETSGMNDVIPKSGKKVAFRGHEGISFYKSMDVLKGLLDLGVVNTNDIKEILTIISTHGTLFDSIKDDTEYKPQRVIEKWKIVPEYFDNFVKQVKYDSTGRFFMSKDGRKTTGHDLGKSIYPEGFMNEIINDNHTTKLIKDNNITMLVGVPCSGKSTWIEDNLSEDDVLISRDSTLIELGRFKYGKDLTYSEIWKKFTQDDQTEVDNMIKNQFEIAVAKEQNIFIDMTNTSKKSRGKWLNYQNKLFKNSYNKKAIVFGTGYDEIMKRNENRFKETGKFVPTEVIVGMMKAFMVPMGNEVDFIDFVF